MKISLFALSIGAVLMAGVPATVAEEINAGNLNKYLNLWQQGVDEQRKTLSDAIVSEFSAHKSPEAPNQLALDMAVPDSPAFSVLNVNSEAAVRPASAQSVAAQLLEGTDNRGNLQTGLALEVTPYNVLGEDVSLERYRTDYGVRLLSRTRFSIATTKGTNEDEDESVKGAFGVSATLWDEGDLQKNNTFRTCNDQFIEFDGDVVEKVVKAVSDAVKREKKTYPDKEEAFKDWNKRYRAVALKEYVEVDTDLQFQEFMNSPAVCNANARLSLWNASSWDVGFSPIFFSEDGSLDGLDTEGFAIWTSLAYGFEDFENIEFLRQNSQLILHARYHSDERVVDPTEGSNRFIEQDQLVLASQLRIAPGNIKLFGSDELEGGTDWTLFADVAYIEESPSSAQDEELWRYAVGAEFAIADGAHFKLSLGSESGRDNGDDEGFILGRLKFNFAAPTGTP